jgi:hypothetical protein
VYYRNQQHQYSTFLRPPELRHLDTDLDAMITWMNPGSMRRLEGYELDMEPYPYKGIQLLKTYCPWVLGLTTTKNDVGGNDEQVYLESGAEYSDDDFMAHAVLDKKLKKSLVRPFFTSFFFTSFSCISVCVILFHFILICIWMCHSLLLFECISGCGSNALLSGCPFCR